MQFIANNEYYEVKFKKKSKKVKRGFFPLPKRYLQIKNVRHMNFKAEIWIPMLYLQGHNFKNEKRDQQQESRNSDT